MEHRIWLLLIIVLIAGFAVVLTCAAVFYFGKRLKTLESRVNDIDVWISCVDDAVPQDVAFNIQTLYRKRMAARVTRLAADQ